MKIEIKNIKTFRGHDGFGYNADVYADGKKVIHVLEDGWGGPLDLQPVNFTPEGKELCAKAIEECKRLCDLKYTGEDAVKVEKAEFYIGVEIEEIINKKEAEKAAVKNQKKFEKMFPTTLVFVEKGGGGYYPVTFGKPARTLAALSTLQGFSAKIAELRLKYANCDLINTNISKDNTII